MESPLEEALDPLREPSRDGRRLPASLGSEPDIAALAEQLVAAARDRGIALTGEDGLLTALTQHVLQQAEAVDLPQHCYSQRGARFVIADSSRTAVAPSRAWAWREFAGQSGYVLLFSSIALVGGVFFLTQPEVPAATMGRDSLRFVLLGVCGVGGGSIMLLHAILTMAQAFRWLPLLVFSSRRGIHRLSVRALPAGRPRLRLVRGQRLVVDVWTHAFGADFRWMKVHIAGQKESLHLRLPAESVGDVLDQMEGACQTIGVYVDRPVTDGQSSSV